jgi:hypothetical protein
LKYVPEPEAGAIDDAATNEFMSVGLFSYSVLLLRYLNSSERISKLKVSKFILFEAIVMVESGTGNPPVPSSPVSFMYDDTTGCVNDEANVMRLD